MNTTEPGTAAERISYQIFLNCYLREIKNWSLNNISDSTDMENLFLNKDVKQYIQIELEKQNAVVVFGVLYWSLTRRHQFLFPVYIRRGAALWQAISLEECIEATLIETARDIECTKPPELDVLKERILNSRNNIDLFLTGRTQDFSKLFNGEKQSFITTEQAMLIGHQTHPVSKSRAGFNVTDMKRYSPELAGRFRLRYFSVHPELLHTDSALDQPADSIIRSMLENYDNESKRMTTTAGSEVGLLPMHPWQADYVKNNPDFTPLFADGRIIDMGECGPEFTATSSVRTLYSPQFEYMLKFSLNIRVTNSVRINKAWELDRALEMKRLMDTPYGRQIQDDVLDFVFIQDPAYLAVKWRDKLLEPFSCLFREASFSHTYDDITCISALVQDHPLGGPNRLAQIISGIAQRENRSEGHVAADWYTRYLEVAMHNLLKLFFKWGLCFEAHGQNSMLALKDGYPYKYLYRDSQGYFHRQASHDDFTKVIPKLGEVTESIFPEDLANERLVYYLIINQLYSVVNAFGTQALLDERMMLGEFAALLERMKSEDNRYPTDMIDHLLNHDRLPCKGNLLTQLFDMDELIGDIATQSYYVTIENAIKSFTPVKS